MHRSTFARRASAAAVLLTTLALGPAHPMTQPSTAESAHAATPQELWRLWPEKRFVSSWSPSYRHADLVADLRRLQEAHETLDISVEGKSFEGRAIHRLRLGTGSMHVLLWSQMHGDEPSATPALLDLVNFLLTEPESPWAAPILSALTLDIVPMLNPDGAERATRRNAQAIDINRDALNLATPEGRVLKEIRDRYEHVLGFNLHDQGRRKEVGDTDVLATAAVLAVAGDEAKTVTPGRERAMRVCAAIVDALAGQYPGGVARYNDSFNERAFGDNVTAWGTPVALLESGGLRPGEPVTNLVRLNFVALLHALRAVARNDAADYDEETYSSLPFNRSGPWVDVLLRGAQLQQSPSSAAYRGDLAFNVELRDRATEVDLEEWLRADQRQARSWLLEVGDARALEGSVELELDGHLVVPAAQVVLRGWKQRRMLDTPGPGGHALDHLARLGVGTVHWLVGAARLDDAAAWAERARSDGRPLVVVHQKEAAAARHFVTLQELPPSVAADQPPLRVLLNALGATDLAAVTTELAAGKPPLRPTAPASFIVLDPGEQDALAAEERAVHSIWIDGLRVR